MVCSRFVRPKDGITSNNGPKTGIPFSIWEAEANLAEQRSGDWSIGAQSNTLDPSYAKHPSDAKKEFTGLYKC